ncbi:MAG: hypothetical protein ACI9P5_004717 [Saprospiraceae bacterium]|jgi:hypothetical protein
MKPQDVQDISENKDTQSGFYTAYMHRDVLLSQIEEYLKESQNISQLIINELRESGKF